LLVVAVVEPTATVLTLAVVVLADTQKATSPLHLEPHTPLPLALEQREESLTTPLME
jgi:hypothetical protein